MGDRPAGEGDADAVCLAGEAVKRESISPEEDRRLTLRVPVCVQTAQTPGHKDPRARAPGTRRTDACPKDRRFKTRPGSELSERVRAALPSDRPGGAIVPSISPGSRCSTSLKGALRWRHQGGAVGRPGHPGSAD